MLHYLILFEVCALDKNLILVTEMNCGNLVRGECIPNDVDDECGAGKRTLSRPCVDGTFEKCSIACKNETVACTAGENKPDCEITTATAPTGKFDSFHQMSLLIACTYISCLQFCAILKIVGIKIVFRNNNWTNRRAFYNTINKHWNKQKTKIFNDAESLALRVGYVVKVVSNLFM